MEKKKEMNEVKNKNDDYVTRVEFKKANKKLNVMLAVLALCVLYMYYFGK